MGHERQRCNATYLWTYYYKPGYTMAQDPNSGTPALGAREGAGRRGWQPMANGPMGPRGETPVSGNRDVGAEPGPGVRGWTKPKCT